APSGLAIPPPFPHVPRPWPPGVRARCPRPPGRLLVMEGCAMNALTQLGMVSDFPSENQTTDIRSAAAENDRKDYFVERDGMRYAGTHLLADLWGASQLDEPDHIDAALREAALAA